MFGRILLVCWILVLGSIVLLELFPGLALRIPHPRYVQAFLMTLMLLSIGYGVARVFREGMKKARR